MNLNSLAQITSPIVTKEFVSQRGGVTGMNWVLLFQRICVSNITKIRVNIAQREIWPGQFLHFPIQTNLDRGKIVGCNSTAALLDTFDICMIQRVHMSNFGANNLRN